MSNEEMIVALNTVVEALGRHDLEIILADNKRLREENERLKHDLVLVNTEATILRGRILDAKEVGASEMVEIVLREDRYYTVSEMGFDEYREYVLQLWREGRGK